MSFQVEIFIKALSRLLGWIYTFCWSASFYPQPISNYQRRSTIGLAIDFPTINALGYVCYTGYTAAFLYSPVIHRQYAARHPGSEDSTVRFNDFIFAVHAVILSTLTYTQFWPMIWGFKVSRFQRVSKPVAGLFWGSIVAVAILILIVLGQSPDGGYEPSTWAWIDVVYGLSYVKLLVTITKYVPQAWVNYKRKSTQGWHIGQILLDLAGGILSLLQLFIDSSFQDDWSGITGNPVKLLLSNISILFDALFMVQHYILYRDADDTVDKHSDPDATTPLLSESNGGPRAEAV
ncbi:PQ loop repeat-domain-containing protein [Aspergillus coremiiformis]|uniref:PQ loop repeat-domain-containing protein n=1 Tax=Aspergillus coremiiformis TaxID=138285 RepID=A0A5N6YXW2_9EURO|nr:PQ loop repeat-domain-containing protein [Aspergillus coremiiformis]